MGRVRCQSSLHCGLLFKPESDAIHSSRLSWSPSAHSSPWLSSPPLRGCWHPVPTQHQPEHSGLCPAWVLAPQGYQLPTAVSCPASTSLLGKGSMAHSRAAGLRWVIAVTEEFGKAADSCREHFREHHLHWDLMCVHLGSGPHNADHLFVDAN